MKKILITGFNGFVGQHAAKEFRNRGFKILGLTNTPVNDLIVANLVDEVIVCDLTNRDEISKLEFDGVTSILNLAGFATNTGGDAQLIHDINIGVHVNLYNRILELGYKPRIIAVSSGSVYDPSQQMPENEESILKSADSARPYESSKIMMEDSIKKFTDLGLDIVTVRPFNHIGPGQGPGFIVPDLAAQIQLSLESGQALMVGNLETQRDYTDVRDVVRAYAEIVCSDNLNHRLYNICSNRSYSGSQILEYLMVALGADKQVKIEIDPNKLRANDSPVVLGSFDRLKNDTGWEPKIPIETSIYDFAANLR